MYVRMVRHLPCTRTHTHTETDRQTWTETETEPEAEAETETETDRPETPPSAPLVGKVGKGEESLEYVVRILLGAPACFGAQFGV